MAKRIHDNQGILAFRVPPSLRVRKYDGEHGDVHYVIRAGKSTLRIASGPYWTGKKPAWAGTARRWEAGGFKGEDFRLAQNGRHSRYVTLNAPMGFTEYKDVPAPAAAKFDAILDSLCHTPPKSALPPN